MTVDLALAEALAQIRGVVLDEEVLVRAVASGRRRGTSTAWRRAELRWVDLRAGRRLQITTYDKTQAHTANYAPGSDAHDAVNELYAASHWRVETTTEIHDIRITKRGCALMRTEQRTTPVPVDRGHDRDKERLIAADDPLLVALGISDSTGHIRASRQAKWRQIEEFLRLLEATLSEALDQGHLRRPSPEDPLRVVDLGCGNAYLTLAASRYLSDHAGLSVHLTGVDVKQQSADHNRGVAQRLGIDADFVVSTIGKARLDSPPDVVLALHACDTATDEALWRAVGWEAPIVLAAPCCHHDIAAQLRSRPTPEPWQLLIRHGILRERLADTLTDALRAGIVRGQGYRVDVVEFVGSEHTPRNTLLRAVRTGSKGDTSEVIRLTEMWGVQPHLARLLCPSDG